MKRLLAAVAGLALIAATPQEVLPGLESGGYYIEDGAAASEQVVSDAVFDGRADGGRLYIVVLADEPPGGATTFSDSTLDLLDGDGYVLTVGPETVGWAGDSTFWTAAEMDRAVDAALDGGSDDEVLQLFAATLSSDTPIDEPGGAPDSSGGGISLGWVILIGAIVAGVWWFMSRRANTRRTQSRLDAVRGLAKQKLAEVANDILEMEDEVATTNNPEVKRHYERASAMYSTAMEDTERATTVAAMVEVSSELDMAIWELDSAEAILDGKPPPPKPQPPTVEPPVTTPPQSVPEGQSSLPQGTVPPVPDFNRRPQRQSGASNDIMTMLMAMMAMGGMRNRGGGFGGGFGGSGGWTGSGGGAPRPRMGGGGGRIRGGGRRRG